MKNKLKEIRDAQKISQEELSSISGVSRTTISNIENSENVVVKTSTLIALSEALGKEVSDIFF